MSGEPPAKKQATGKRYKLLSAWFCPYAQRGWIAMEHHKIPHEKIEVLALIPKEGQELKDVTEYTKDPLVLKHHPQGMVPVIVDEEEKEPAVYDSLVCVEFTDDLVNAGIVEGTTPLLPKDPVARAKARIWVDTFNKTVASNFYKVLVPRDQETRVQGMENFRAALRKFQENMKGPFFLGEHLSAVDLAAFPWAFRAVSVGMLERYRGEDFALDRAEFAKIYEWVQACENLPCVKITLPDKERLIGAYGRYAEGTAKSKIGEALRAGKSAHEHD
mmetsp:Transcript_294/g.575  ORF Transcript_294/g.575 Transcript_294/m.575 type:complete len:274 (-) Transcript_294:112-933(-)